LKWKRDFNVGYSPERVNPGDKKHTLVDIVKLVSGDSEETLAKISELYKTIIKAGVYPVSSIKVAEASKVIENTQRDLNISLMNEIAIILNLVGIDTKEVIAAASTKWNFIPMSPGLVGGHCIGVVPYYLTYKAEMLGYHPYVILAGRRMNDGMGKFIADETIKKMIAAGTNILGAKVGIFGLAFKENVEDISNSKVIDIIRVLESFGVEVVVYDPVVKPSMATSMYGITVCDWEDLPQLDAMVVAVSHDIFLEKSIPELTSKLRPSACFMDIQSAFPRKTLEDAGFSVWRL
jgi:UDP-N-acetyl-D-galactosamine dehydrogenase